MEIWIPDNWVEVSKEEFASLISNLNTNRDAFCGGEYYTVYRLVPAHPHCKETFEHRSIKIGARTVHDGRSRWLINPEFFVSNNANVQTNPAPAA